MNLKEFEHLKAQKLQILKRLRQTPFNRPPELVTKLADIDRKIQSDPPSLTTIYGAIGTGG